MIINISYLNYFVTEPVQNTEYTIKMFITSNLHTQNRMEMTFSSDALQIIFKLPSLYNVK